MRGEGGSSGRGEGGGCSCPEMESGWGGRGKIGIYMSVQDYGDSLFGKMLASNRITCSQFNCADKLYQVSFANFYRGFSVGAPKFGSVLCSTARSNLRQQQNLTGYQLLSALLRLRLACAGYFQFAAVTSTLCRW